MIRCRECDGYYSADSDHATFIREVKCCVVCASEVDDLEEHNDLWFQFALLDLTNYELIRH